MPNFNRGDVLNLTLDYDDVVTITGNASVKITPLGGTAYYTNITGTQTLGAYKNTSTALVITCDTAGSYTIYSDASVNPHLILNPAKTGGQDASTGLDIPLGGGQLVIAGLSGATLQNTARLRKGLANVVSGTGNCAVALVGDSTTVGENSTGAGATNCQVKNFAVKSASRLTGMGIPAQNDSFIGDGGAAKQSTAFGVQDPRVVLTTFNSFSTTYIGPGGSNFQTVTTGTIAFTPVGQFDNFKVHYGVFAAAGGFTVNVDGGATILTKATANATAGLATVSGTCALGTHTLNIVGQGNGSLRIIGVECWNSTVPSVRFVNYSLRGGAVSDFNVVGYNNVKTMDYLALQAYDCYVVDLTINDSGSLGNFSNLAQYSIYLQALVTTLLTAGDVIMRLSVPSNPASISQVNQDAYGAAFLAVAAANNLPVLDLRKRWTSWSYSSYFFGGNNLHPNALGYADEAAQFVNFINQL